MAAAINFFARSGLGGAINELSGSGLGFYGPGGYGTSVQVGAYQDNTYITDSTGTASNAIQVNNVKYIASNSGQVPVNTNLLLTAIPNYQATLNISFTNSSAVRTQNAQLTIFDRVSTSNAPSGVVCQVATLIHPWNFTTPAGSGDTVWQQPAGTGVLLMSSYANGCAISPGTSGLCPSGSNTIDVQHDWYFAISALPTSIGSKTQFALYFQLEFL